MFTGIVTDIGVVEAVEVQSGGGRYFRIRSAYAAESFSLGCSVSCDGVCLTVVAFRARDPGCEFEVDVSNESLSLTTLGAWSVGRKINLERALRSGDELGGHLVTGHVDGIADIVERWRDGLSWRFTLCPPLALLPFLAVKGSIALGGVSLTVNEVDEKSFGVNLIEHTMKVTVWSDCYTGQRVNIEVDPFARYVARLIGFRQ
ncbi:MAG: riboflavin synthase [Alphaproteobacteria bacterium]|nr:riboflavin synthase [Alphaproteobacteria bacterium]